MASKQFKKKDRQKGAKTRTKERDERNPVEQLALLDRRLGPGVGAVKERERLNNEWDSWLKDTWEYCHGKEAN